MAFVNPPFDDYDLDLLEEYLLGSDHPDDVMLLSQLDGYLTAIVLAPVPIAPSEWLPGIWGGADPPFGSPEVPSGLHGAIMGLYNDNARSLIGNASSFEPIFDIDTDGAILAHSWSDGFMKGVQLRFADWNPLLEDEEQCVLIAPMIALCSSPDGAYAIDMPRKDRHRMEKRAPAAIPVCVQGVRSFWQQRGLGVALPLASTVPSCKARWLAAQRLATAINPFAIPGQSGKTGRNKPCPCGSGKKFKHCCDA
jgi:uncharacterized protein